MKTFYKDFPKDEKCNVLAIRVASSRHDVGPQHAGLHLLNKAPRNILPGPTRSAGCALPPPPGQLPLPQAQSARCQPGSSRTASSRFPGQRFPTNQRAGSGPAIGWRHQGRGRTFRLRFKNLARKAGPWPAPPLSCAGLERGQTRARNHGIPAPPPRSPPPLCAGAQLLPPRPPAEREAGNGRRCRSPPEPSPSARLARRRFLLRPADLSIHLTVGAGGD